MVVVEYTVHDQMCDECHRREAQDFWRAVVQVRQKVYAIWIRLCIVSKQSERDTYELTNENWSIFIKIIHETFFFIIWAQYYVI